MPQYNNHVWQLDWPHGHAEIQALGGMLAPVWFRLENGQKFQPMHVAPWTEQASDPTLTGLLSRLRGEWPCVPFGGVAPPLRIPMGWTAKMPDNDCFLHGFAAHNYWHLREARPGFLCLTIEYPEASPIAFLDRQIQADPDRPALTVTLCIQVRREVELPVALHATFRMPKIANSLHVSVGEIAQVISYPLSPEPDISRLRPDAHSHSLKAVDATDGPLDLSRLPLSFATEELVQLVECRGAIRLHYLRENACITLDWDRELLPDVLLWISNGGRTYPPWNSRHFALGVEPLAGPFDLGRVATPPADHPLANRLLRLTPDEHLTLRYRLIGSLSNNAVSMAKMDTDS